MSVAVSTVFVTTPVVVRITVPQPPSGPISARQKIVRMNRNLNCDGASCKRRMELRALPRILHGAAAYPARCAAQKTTNKDKQTQEQQQRRHHDGGRGKKDVCEIGAGRRGAT